MKWTLRTLGALIILGLLLWNITLAQEVAETRRMLEEVQETETRLEILAENDLRLTKQVLQLWEALAKRWYGVEISTD